MKCLHCGDAYDGKPTWICGCGRGVVRPKHVEREKVIPEHIRVPLATVVGFVAGLGIWLVIAVTISQMAPQGPECRTVVIDRLMWGMLIAPVSAWVAVILSRRLA